MRLLISKFMSMVFVVSVCCAPSARAFDLAKGLMYAVPAPKGRRLWTVPTPAGTCRPRSRCGCPRNWPGNCTATWR